MPLTTPYSSLWFWMRWLCLGLSAILGQLYAVVDSWGVAIILLAVCVKIIIQPLSAIADRWQERVNKINAVIQPEIKQIKSRHKGDGQTKRVLALYRKHKVHPLYSLRSLFGVAIQIPIFFAAYHTLDEFSQLQGQSFLLINDLGKPDALLKLPLALPYLGDSLNLLPFLMMLVTIAASAQLPQASMSAEQLKSEQRKLYIMAFAFFVLLYQFPASMLLYWTSNNAIELVKSGFVKLWRLISGKIKNLVTAKWSKNLSS